ncbi:hypothetical protein [Streptomyces sp. NPDC051162]|uniref:hypothetical protein n=1 Tax=unclassified Streptomyces TaxID=2593676 RepID=UPI00341B7CBE
MTGSGAGLDTELLPSPGLFTARTGLLYGLAHLGGPGSAVATPPLGAALSGALVDSWPDAAVFLFFGGLLGLLALALPGDGAFEDGARDVHAVSDGAEAVCGSGR